MFVLQDDLVEGMFAEFRLAVHWDRDEIFSRLSNKMVPEQGCNLTTYLLIPLGENETNVSPVFNHLPRCLPLSERQRPSSYRLNRYNSRETAKSKLGYFCSQICDRLIGCAGHS